MTSDLREKRLRALAAAIANHYLESKGREDRFDTLGENHQLAWLSNAGAALAAHDAVLLAAGIPIDKLISGEYVAVSNRNTVLGDLSQHGRSCNALGPHTDEDDDRCTCGLDLRRAVQTEREMHNAWRKRAEEAEAGRAAEGYVIVPKEPTEKMLSAGRLRCNLWESDSHDCDGAGVVWVAMLAAAQEVKP